ncbi:hypothetical protein [Peptoniphilus sp. HMSC062D09]|uniref:hypothetical protein n=1 Tax=Peptoniphilus sp. HMSC062D09 TaxID=1739305 RepID=UPI0008A48AA9|nr:hypothetical protein [Peptoniphilus sp. HMSC062D09]OFK80064.1 hypothetical protein HMPREF2801_07515 [Peptoniphilus sp. HMSC062D09]
MLNGQGRRKYLIYFIIMFVLMIIFLSYAFKHPEASIRIPVAVLHIFYLIYVIGMLACLVKFLKSKK